MYSTFLVSIEDTLVLREGFIRKGHDNSVRLAGLVEEFFVLDKLPRDDVG
jgi:hypothetical protein